ncbi:hypothetical protein ACNKHK_04165 [Shigella flexneri]
MPTVKPCSCNCLKMADPPLTNSSLSLVTLLHNDLLLIIRGNKLSKAQENAAWCTALANNAVQVSCQTPEQAQLPRWVAARAKGSPLDSILSVSGVVYCYEGTF